VFINLLRDKDLQLADLVSLTQVD